MWRLFEFFDRDAAGRLSPQLLMAIMLCLCGAGTGSYAGAEPIDYRAKIKPILAAKCYSCHGALKQEGELRLDTRALLLAGSGSGAVVVPGDPANSPLLHRVSSMGDDRMPPVDEGAPLTEAERATVRQWIEQGAVAPDEPTPPDPREHWAFRPPVRRTVPTAVDAAWSDNPIDAWIAKGHQEHQLQPVAIADKSILLRRLYADLIGLPPTLAELKDFLADDSSHAYARVVDRLLEHPAYGERWGRHWMDVWRYTDWYGLGTQVRYSQKHIWRWRDWIMESLSEDKPYNQMIVEMLAGDELAPTDPNVLRATGFLARNYFIFNRTTWLDNTVEHTSKAFLGLTMNCAKCHDHKYDPLSQVDYYRLRAVFEPHQVRLDPVPGETDLDKNGLPRAFDNDPDTPTYILVRGDEKNPDTSRAISMGAPAVLTTQPIVAQPVPLPPESYHPATQAFALTDHQAKAERQIAEARDALRQAQTSLVAPAAEATASASEAPSEKAAAGPTSEAERRGAIEVAQKSLAAAELYPAALVAGHAVEVAKARELSAEDVSRLARLAAIASSRHAFTRADADLARADLAVGTTQAKADAGAKMTADKARADAFEKWMTARATLEDPGETYEALYVTRRAANGMIDEETPRHGPYAKVSTGRRMALARWIAARENPLTARVAVNQIWMRHFGQPLVEAVTDFGLRSPAPPQQALLDWLAVEFMDHNWSMKHLHRLMVHSRAYKLHSTLRLADEATRAADPKNDYYWHRHPRRMESQMVRDTMIALAGLLDPAIGGPDIETKLESTTYRRTMYFSHKNEGRAPFTYMFDDADILDCYRRRESIVPQQALALANSKLSLTVAEKIAARLRQEMGDSDNDAFIVAAFETVLVSQPSDEELQACRDALQQTETLLKSAQGANLETVRDRARKNLIHSLLNHNDFITIR